MQAARASTAEVSRQLASLAYLGAYGTHMFALWVWVGDGTSKIFFFLFYHFENA